MERNGDGGGQGKKNGHREEEIPAAEAKPEKKNPDVVKTSKDDADPKPAPEAEKAKKTSSGSSEAKQPVPTTRKGSTGGGSKTVPNPPGSAPKTVPNTPTAAAKSAGSNKEQDKKSDGSGFYGFLKRA